MAAMADDASCEERPARSRGPSTAWPRSSRAAGGSQFAALVVVGDGDGRVGLGYGKAKEVPARHPEGHRGRQEEPLRRAAGRLDDHPPVLGVYGAGRVLLKPAAPGTGVIAGGAARVILEEAGVHDVLCKSLGSSNHINVARATIAGLKAPQAARRDRPPPRQVARGGHARRACSRAYRETKRGPAPEPDGGGVADGRPQGDPGAVGHRHQAQAPRHAPGPRPRPHRQDQRPARPARDPGHDRPGPAPRRRSRRSRTSEGPRPEARRRARTAPHAGSAAASAARAARPPAGAPRARAPAARSRPASRAASCRCSRAVPKLKGFKNPFRVEYAVVNLDTLEAFEGDEVTPETLRAQGLVHKHGLVKVLGRGELTRAVTVQAHAFSKSAEQAITAAGGTRGGPAAAVRPRPPAGQGQRPHQPLAAPADQPDRPTEASGALAA